MKTVFLHIGTGKTGTSTIQNFLYANRDVLLGKFGILYPKAGLDSLEHFGETINAHYSVVHWIKSRNEQLLQVLVKEIEHSNAEIAVLSCETFYHDLNKEDIEFLASVFAGQDVRIICYVRRQDQYIESAWKQQVKVGDMGMPFDKFIMQHKSAEFLEIAHANYYRMLQPWREVFGVENIKLHVFSPTEWPNKKLVDDFWCALGRGIDELTYLHEPVVANFAMPSELMRLLVVINRTKLVSKSKQSDLIAYLTSLRDYNNPPLLTNLDRKEVVENYAISNQHLFSEFCGTRVPGCFLQKAIPLGDAGKPGGMSEGDIAVRALIAAWDCADKSNTNGYFIKYRILLGNITNALSDWWFCLKGKISSGHVNVNQEAPKKWPPDIDVDLPYEPNLTATDIIALIKKCQKEHTPLSIIRLGDGESAVIGYPEYTPVDRYEHFLKVFFGKNVLTEEQKRNFVELVRASVRVADVVGVIGGQDVTKFTIVRYFMNYYGLANNLVGIARLSLHRNLQEQNLYDELLRDQETVGLITCREVEGVLKKAYGIKHIVTYKIPEEVAHAENKNSVGRHFPERFEEIRQSLKVPQKGMLFLVGAGPLGKVYCQWIKEKGGIALDVGSIFDAWAGKATRAYMKTNEGAMNDEYTLKATPSI